MKAMTLGAAKLIAGSLGFPSKMPGTSYGLPAAACVTGAKLAKIAGTACASCYAMHDTYTWTNPRKAMARRLQAITHPHWVAAMSQVLSHAHAQLYRRIDLGLRGPKLKRVGSRYRLNEMGFHRWHDSGDVQSVDHLARICAVASQTANVKHWLPTQELGLVRRFVADGGKVPANLLIRVSSVFVDDAHTRAWPTTSSVFTNVPPKGAWICPAPKQDHMCKSCRACWTNTPHVAYAAH